LSKKNIVEICQSKERGNQKIEQQTWKANNIKETAQCEVVSSGGMIGTGKRLEEGKKTGGARRTYSLIWKRR